MKNGRNILFIHIPKSAGTSIEKHFLTDEWFCKLIDTGIKPSINHIARCSPQHMHMTMLEMIINFDKLDCNFTIVRNPASRLISEYNWRRKYFKLESSINDFVHNTLDFYSKDSFVFDNHIRPQIEFIRQDTKVFKIEDGLHRVVSWLDTKHGVKRSSNNIPYEQSSKTADGDNNTINELTYESRKRIYEFYKDDYIQFGYNID